MRQITGTRKSPGETIVKDIKRATRKHYSSEEKIRIVLDGLRGEACQGRRSNSSTAIAYNMKRSLKIIAMAG
jgi:transposase-like protein